MDLALNNLQRLICHKTQQTKPNQLIHGSNTRERDRERWGVEESICVFVCVWPFLLVSKEEIYKNIENKNNYMLIDNQGK